MSFASMRLGTSSRQHLFQASGAVERHVPIEPGHRFAHLLDHARRGINLVTDDLGATAGKDYTLVLTMPPSSVSAVRFGLAPRDQTDQQLKPVQVNGSDRPAQTLNLVQTTLND